MHDFEVIGYELISKEGDIHLIVCYGCYENLIPKLRDDHNIEYEHPIYYSDKSKTIPTYELYKEPIPQIIVD